MRNLCFSDIMLKMLNLLKHVFYYRNTVFFSVTAVRKMNKTCKTHAQNRCLKSVRKIRVIWSQNGVQKGHLKRLKAHIFRPIFACYFRHVFEVVLGSKMNRTWVQKGVQNVTKNHEKSTPAPECDFGAIWGRILIDFGKIWGRFLRDFGQIWGRFLNDFELFGDEF